MGFGLPVFMLPDKMEGEGTFAEYYNKVFGNSTYKEKVKPIVDKALGGSLRLFVEKVYEGSYFNRDEGEVVLYVNANLPNGSTLEQMNALVKKMETYLSDFKEIRQFQTAIYSARQANLQIYFTKEVEHSGFPYTLKSNIISKALTLGGGSWGVYGLQDQGFNNDVRESAGSFRVKMYGYNYDELAYWGDRLKEKLLEHRRIKEVIINSEFSWWKDDYSEFYLDLNRERMAKENITAIKIKSSRMLLAHGFLRKVFEIFESYQTSIDMICTSVVGVSVSIDNTKHLNEILDDLKKYGTVTVDKDMCIICVVGDLEWENVGFEAKALDAMRDIPVRMISFGGSNYNISFIIRECDKKQALQSLSDALFNE